MVEQHQRSPSTRDHDEDRFESSGASERVPPSSWRPRDSAQHKPVVSRLRRGGSCSVLKLVRTVPGDGGKIDQPTTPGQTGVILPMRRSPTPSCVPR